MVPFIHHGPPPWGFGWSPQPPSLIPCFLPKSHLSSLPRRCRGRAQTTTAGHDFALKYYPLARERRLAVHSIHVADFWLFFFFSAPLLSKSVLPGSWEQPVAKGMGGTMTIGTIEPLRSPHLGALSPGLGTTLLAPSLPPGLTWHLGRVQQAEARAGQHVVAGLVLPASPHFLEKI